MSPLPAHPISLFRVGPRQRRLRLATGCVLFAYVTTHLIDHSLGNISLGAMEAMLRVQKWIWQGVVGTTLLYGSLLIHPLLGVWSLYARRYVGWRLPEVVQLVLGLSIPALLANHVAVTRGAKLFFGADKTYSTELHVMWVALPILGVIQVTVLIVAWTHACIGLHYAPSACAVGTRARGGICCSARCCCRCWRCSASRRARATWCATCRTRHGGPNTSVPRRPAPRVRRPGCLGFATNS